MDGLYNTTGMSCVAGFAFAWLEYVDKWMVGHPLLQIWGLGRGSELVVLRLFIYSPEEKKMVEGEGYGV